ncbi:methyl-accepting chemotaxis protein [Pallidibacillus pasinlerensis]|uniref:Chemotaxis protein n=1 Tax=Pallidibacillus pasinlerensis TaxID=2703818 RepID=A0ABX0A324_9BACI|nr:methyl-accepting chemotaxis protein [Pallidibacillus pasinlerensis]NCU17833.1 chemotaxis protein [Pallidibacillus pasinlerensis]
MFSRKYKPTVEEIQFLKQRIDELNARLDEREDEFQIFLNNLHKDLLSTIEDNEKVNEEHHVIMNKVTALNHEFSMVEDSTNNNLQNTLNMAGKGNSLIRSAESMVVISEQGKQSIDELKDIIDHLGNQLKENTIAMGHLSESSKEIEEIIHFISGISNNINLLSLNASIEAARAGEHGKGFAVVAKEIRKLAESAGSSTTNIIELIKKIQEEIEHANENSQASYKIVEQGIEANVHANDEIGKLMEVISVVKEKVQELLNYIEKQKTTSEDVIIKFNDSKELFQDTNEILIEHIKEGEVISQKLIDAVQEVEKFKRNSRELEKV